MVRLDDHAGMRLITKTSSSRSRYLDQRPPGHSHVVRHRLGHGQGRHPCRHGAQQAAHLRRAFDVGYLLDVPADQVGHVGIEEARPASPRSAQRGCSCRPATHRSPPRHAHTVQDRVMADLPLHLWPICRYHRGLTADTYLANLPSHLPRFQHTGSGRSGGPVLPVEAGDRPLH